MGAPKAQNAGPDRVCLGTWPTPVEGAPRLAVRLGLNPESLWIKRDDLTGLGAGGNKVRKLEYLCAAAVERGATILVTSGGAQSNHGRLTAASACRLGMACLVVLAGEPPTVPNGNIALEGLMGAQVVWAGEVDDDELDGQVGGSGEGPDTKRSARRSDPIGRLKRAWRARIYRLRQRTRSPSPRSPARGSGRRIRGDDGGPGLGAGARTGARDQRGSDSQRARARPCHSRCAVSGGRGAAGIRQRTTSPPRGPGRDWVRRPHAGSPQSLDRCGAVRGHPP